MKADEADQQFEQQQQPFHCIAIVFDDNVHTHTPSMKMKTVPWHAHTGMGKLIFNSARHTDNIYTKQQHHHQPSCPFVYSTSTVRSAAKLGMCTLPSNVHIHTHDKHNSVLAAFPLSTEAPLCQLCPSVSNWHGSIKSERRRGRKKKASITGK